MGGIKHGMWGMLPFHDSKMPENYEDQIKYYAEKNIVLCKLCGSQILTAMQNEHGGKANWEWEMRYSVHEKCYSKYLEELKGKQHGN